MAYNTIRTDYTYIAAHFDDSVRADEMKNNLNLVFDAVNKMSNGYKLITYATSMTPSLSDGSVFEIRATDTVAYTIANPTNPISGQTIHFIIKNGSGGTMGNVTFGNAFKLGAAFDKPADTKYRVYSFVYNGTYWFEVSRSAADIA